MPRTRTQELVVVSNRLPELADPGAGPRPKSVGGLVSALLPAIEGTGGGSWFGWDGKGERASPGRLTVRRSGSIRTYALPLRRALVDRFYNGYCNGALWPLLHGFPGRFAAGGDEHAAYREVNEAFARAIRRNAGTTATVWVHDFHLFGVGRELRALGFRGRIGFFLHVPFPSPEVLELLPWARELLEDLAAYDLVGYHTPAYADCHARAAHALGVRRPRAIGVYPIGIDPTPYEEWSREDSSVLRGRELRNALMGRKLILGVDRLDYTKGIPARLRIVQRLFERHPDWRRRVGFIQISAPSRERVAEYVRQRREVEELVGNVNGRLGDPDWVPVRYLFKSYSQRELAAFYREADVCLVTPLRDGMNLVAKEYVAAQTGDPGVLLLSRFAGAAAELTDALQVNPYDIDASADALARALAMPLEERVLRQRKLLACVREQTAARWASTFLKDLEASPASPRRRKEAVVGP